MKILGLKTDLGQAIGRLLALMTFPSLDKDQRTIDSGVPYKPIHCDICSKTSGQIAIHIRLTLNNNPYQPPNAESDDAIDQSVSEADRFPARNVLLKLDTANLVVWFAIYALFAIVLKLMIDGLYTSYEYPFLQIVTGFVVPMTAFIIGIVANILLLGSVGFGKWLAGFRVVMSSIAAVVSVPLLGYESKFTIAENVTKTIPMAAICTGCLLYYCYYLRRIYAR